VGGGGGVEHPKGNNMNEGNPRWVRNHTKNIIIGKRGWEGVKQRLEGKLAGQPLSNPRAISTVSGSGDRDVQERRLALHKGSIDSGVP